MFYGSISAYLALPHARERSPRCFLNLAYVLRLFCLLSRSSPTKSRRSNGAHSKGTLPVASCRFGLSQIICDTFTNQWYMNTYACFHLSPCTNSD